MPNWCHNKVKIEGSVKNINLIYDLLFKKCENGDMDITFDKFLKTPEDLLNGEGWYDWRIEKWGVKWDAILFNFRKCKKTLYFEIDTAWGPPDRFFENLSKKFLGTEITLMYSEPGMQFQGTFEIENGEVFHMYIENMWCKTYLSRSVKFHKEQYKKYLVSLFNLKLKT